MTLNGVKRRRQLREYTKSSRLDRLRWGRLKALPGVEAARLFSPALRAQRSDGLFHTGLDQNIDMNSPRTVGAHGQRIRMSTR